MDIYVISLLEPTLTESDLQQLFNNLPRRCVVLLEDIDTAGLVREDPADNTPAASTPNAEPTNGGGRRGRRTTTENADGSTTTSGTGISLSGLLNAIDGVASHEGRVLIMTSNFPEKLDAALIRPGRVDMQVAFTLATTLQIKEIFVKMYVSDPQQTFDATTQEENGGVDAKYKKAIATKHVFGREELQPLAERFAEILPEGRFSPAEVQNFLIARKKDPYKALEEIEAWRDEVLEAKERKSRVVTAT